MLLEFKSEVVQEMVKETVQIYPLPPRAGYQTDPTFECLIKMTEADL